MYEYSPASVLASVPPAMCWLNAMFSATGPLPGSPVKKRNAVAPTASSAGVGRGHAEPPAKTYAPTGRSTGPATVPSLNATLYGRKTSSPTIRSAGTGK